MKTEVLIFDTLERLNSEASKVRVALRSALDIGYLSANTGLCINAFLINAPAHHPHHAWHSHCYIINVALAQRDFKLSNGHLSPPHCETSARAPQPYTQP